MTPDIAFYVVGAIAVVILGLSKGGFAGIGMISTPLFALVAGPVTAAAMILPILMVQDVVAVVMYRRSCRRDLLMALVPGAVAGVLIAYLFASRVAEWAVELTLGILSLLFALQQIIAHFRRASMYREASDNDRLLGFFCGMGSGFTSTIAHAGAPPFQFYMLPKRLDRDSYIGTNVVFFAAVNVMKLPAFIALGQLSAANMKLAALFVPLAIVSSWLGVYLVRRINVQTFNMAISAILLGVSVLLIIQGVIGMH